MHFLNHLLTTPTFKDEEKAYQVYLLNIILITLIVIPVPFILYLLTQKPEDINRIFAIIVLAEIINITLFLMLKRGYVRQVSTAHIITLWLIFAVSSATTTSVQSVAYMLGNGLVITMAVILLGENSALAMTFLAIIQGGVMVYAELHGWIPPKILNDPLYIWAIVIVMFVAVLGMQIIAAKKLRTALTRARTSEERYRFISQVSSDYTFSIEVDSQYSMHLNWVAGAFEQITGYTFEEYITSGGWLAHLHPEDAMIDSQSTTVLKTNQPTTTEVRTFKKSGDLCWVRVYSHPIWDEEQNRLTGIVGAVQEISKQKQSGITLTQERDLLQTFLDNIPDSVYFKDTESRFMRINKAQANFLKLNSPLDAIGKTDLDFFTPNLAHQFLKEEKQILASGQPIFNRIEFNPTEDGKPRWIAATKAPVRDSSGNLMGTIGISRDITQQKTTEAMLDYQRDILQIFMDNIPEQVYFKDTESRFVRINQEQARFLGVGHPQDAIGKTDLDFQSPELAQDFLAEEKRIIETGQPILNRIEFNPTREGKLRWLSTSKFPAKNELGQIIGTIGMSINITEQKLAGELEDKRHKILEKVLALGKHVAEVNDLQTTLDRIWHAVVDDLGFDRIGLFFYNPERNSMDRMLGTDKHGKIENFPGLSFPIDEWSTFKQVLDKPDGLYFTNNFDIENNIPEGHEMYGVKSYVAVAVWAGSKPVAVISVDQFITQHPIPEYQIEALRLYAGYAGLAIENSRLNETLQSELAEQKKAEEAEQHRRLILEKVIQLVKQVTEVSDLKTTLKRIWHAVHDELDFDRLGIFLYNAERNSMDSMLGTDVHGNIKDTTGTWFIIEGWSTFKQVLDKPDGLYLTNNFDVDHNVPEGHEMYGVKSYAAVAVWAGDKPVAVIGVDQLITQRTITTQQIEALRLFAGYAGLAIENSRLKEALQNELAEQKKAEENEQDRRIMLEKIVKLGQYVTEVQDLHTTLQRIWNTVRNELDFDRLGIYLYNSDNNTMNGSYGTSSKGEILEEWGTQVPLTNDDNNIERNAFWKALQEPNGIYFTHQYEIEHNTPKEHIMYGVKDFAAVAAWAGNKPVAVICVDQQPTQRPITDYQLEMLRQFAGYAGLAIENSRLKEAIQNELNEQKQLEEKEQRRRIILEKIIKLGQVVTEVQDLRTTLIRIWHGIHDGLGFDRLGIRLYNPERESMDGTFGTSNQGEMIDEWNDWISLKQDNPGSGSLLHVLEKPGNISFTHDFEGDYKITIEQNMLGVKDHAAIGAWAGEKPVAIISVDNMLTNRTITEEELEALRLFAGYAGLAIENARLKDTIENELIEEKKAEESEQRRRMMMQKVVQLGKQVTEASDFRTTLQKIWQGVREDLDFDRVGLFTYDSQENVMIGAYGTDREGKIWDAWHIQFGLDDSALFHKVLSRPDGFFFSSDFEKEFNLLPDHDMIGVKYAALVAVWAGNKPVAIISVDQLTSGRMITEEQMEALRLFAGYAGLAIENSRLKDAIEKELIEQKQAEEIEQRRRMMMEKVVELGKQVTEVNDFETTLRKIWQGLRYDLDFDRVGLFIYDAQENSMTGAYGTDRTGNIWDAWHVKIGLSDTEHIDDSVVFHKMLDRPGGFYSTTDYEGEFNLPSDHPMAGVKHYAVVAVWAGDKPVAFISVDQLVTGRAFSDEQLEALRLFAGYAGLAISNSRLNTAIEEELTQRQSFITELEKKNAELERFTYTVSHDLKSPLVTITGFLGYLEQDALSGNMEKVRSNINRISSAAHKMQALLNDLLELSRIGRLMNPPEDIAMVEVIHEAVDRVRGKLDEINAVIEIQRDLPSISGDRVRLIEVVQNLIENAAKYSNSKIQPRIEIGAQDDKSDTIATFYVRDNGIGIAPKYHENIFGLFNKLNATSEGTGIGLTLVKRIIEVHGGNIWVESEVGNGATFYFTLPRAHTKE